MVLTDGGSNDKSRTLQAALAVSGQSNVDGLKEMAVRQFTVEDGIGWLLCKWTIDYLTDRRST